jgi:2-alkyl-3-oxoalkanoate reductase
MSRVVVTGGGGFVGKNLIRSLQLKGFQVASIARSEYPFLKEAGVETLRWDLCADGDDLRNFIKNASAVFHVAAKVDMWGPYQDFYRANVVATQNIINACQKGGVSKLIYTSSPSVVAGGEDLCGIDESYPYPEHYLAHYPATKALAEREVLAANGVMGLRTLALRPHLIWGLGDTNLIPAVIEKARSGQLMMIGSGENLSDFTYIDECVDAHICAFSALDNVPESQGKAYFISQGEPVKLWWWVNQILEKAGLPPITKSIPVPVAESLAFIIEGFAKLINQKSEPRLTRFLVKEMATNHYFNIIRARSLLGYRPQKSTVERLKEFSLS